MHTKRTSTTVSLLSGIILSSSCNLTSPLVGKFRKTVTMDWSTSALIHNSPLARRLPGQETPPDPTIQQVHAADLTYGWHTESSHGSETESENIDDDDEEEEEGEAAAAEGSTGAMTRQQEAARALRQRRRERRATRRRLSNSSASSSSEGSIVSYNSATAGEKEADEKVADEGENLPTSRTDGGTQAGNGNSSEHDADSFICRICFDGPGSEDEGGETLGKLIAPCRCRGTMKVRDGKVTNLKSFFT